MILKKGLDMTFMQLFSPFLKHACFLMLLLLLVSFLGGCSQSSSNTIAQHPPLTSVQLQALLPDSVGKKQPVILDFQSKFCLACQQIKPKLENIVKNQSQIHLVSIDINQASDQDKKIMKTFGVSTVPYVVFISGTGEIQRIFLEDAPLSEFSKASKRLVHPIPVE